MFKDNTNAESSITMQLSIGSYVSLFNRVFLLHKDVLNVFFLNFNQFLIIIKWMRQTFNYDDIAVGARLASKPAFIKWVVKTKQKQTVCVSQD